MYSLKPGRGPSALGGIMGIFLTIFGIVWTVIAFNIVPWMAVFGLVFVGMALAGVIYNFYNASAKNRMSALDITKDNEETDPFASALGHGRKTLPPLSREEASPSRFCPFCGKPLKEDFRFCPDCGKSVS